MTDYSPFLSTLVQKLNQSGFSISRDVDSSRFTLEIIGVKTDLSPLRGNRAHFIVVTTMELPSPESVTDFAEFSYSFSLANRSKFVPEKESRMVWPNYTIIPVAVSESFTEEMKGWIMKKIRAKHFQPFNFPVLIASSSRETYYCKKTPLLGAIAWRGVRKFAEEELSFAN